MEFLRESLLSLGCDCGVTLVGGLVVARFAAKESAGLKVALRSFLSQLETDRSRTVPSTEDVGMLKIA